MAGPKSSSGDATAEVCVNCGMPPCKMDPTLSITLLFSKATRHVLCVEAGKDFVDTLMGFLTLPVGCIVKLLEQASLIHRPECKLARRPSTPLVFPPDCPYTPAPKKGKNDSGEHFALSSISNVFTSVVRLDSKEMSTDKNCLVDPKPTVPFGAGKLLDLQNKYPVATTSGNSAESVDVANYYSCGNACSLYSTSPATKCPKHKKKMSVPMKFVAGNLASGSDGSDRGEENSQEQPDSIKSVRSARGQRGRQCDSDSCAPKVPSRRSLRVRSVVPASDSEFVRRVTRGLDMQLALPTSPGPSIDRKGGGGYVKEGTKYMVTNTLEIYASAEAIKALIALNIIRCERVCDLDTMPISVVTAEVLQLLKLSFTSTNVLQDVFGKYCADVKSFFKRSPNLFFLSAWKTLAASVFVWGLLWHPRVYPCDNTSPYGHTDHTYGSRDTERPPYELWRIFSKTPSPDCSLCHVRESQQQLKTKVYMLIIVEDDPGPETLESLVKL